MSFPVVSAVADGALDGDLLGRPGQALRPQLRRRRVEVLLDQQACIYDTINVYAHLDWSIVIVTLQSKFLYLAVSCMYLRWRWRRFQILILNCKIKHSVR